MRPVNAGDRSWDDDTVEVAWVAKRANHVAKTIKGVLVAMAASLALEATSDPGAAALGLIGTVIAIGFASIYGDWLQTEIEEGRRLRPGSLPLVAGRSAGVALGALPATLLFVAAWLGLVSAGTAVDLSLWIGVGLLFVFGYVGARLRRDTRGGAALQGLLLSVVGLGVLALKYLL